MLSEGQAAHATPEREIGKEPQVPFSEEVLPTEKDVALRARGA